MKKQIIFLCLLSTVAYSQKTVPLTKLWSIADSANFDLRRLELAVNQSKLGLSQARNQWGPKVGVTSKFQYQSESFGITMPPPLNQSFVIMQNNNYFNIAWMDWTLFEGLKRFYEIDKEKYTSESIRSNRQFVMETMRHQLTRTALVAEMLNYEKEIIEHSKERIRINLDKAKRLSHEGQIAPADTLEFWQGLLDIDKRLAEVHKKENDLFNEIGFILAQGEAIKPETLKKMVIAPEFYAHLAERSDQKSLLWEAKAIDEKYAAMGGLYWPKISANLAWHYDKPGYDPIQNDWVSYGTANVSLNWLLWDWNQRKNIREQIEIQKRDNQIRQQKLKYERQKNLANLTNEYGELSQKFDITKTQLQYKQRYYQHRKKQYELAQIDANQLSVTENELTILELTEKLMEIKIKLNQLDRVYVCGNFYKWSIEQEESK